MPKKNRLTDLTDHLFAQLERLSDETLTGDELAEEVKRAEAVVALADQINATAQLSLTAARLYADHGDKILPMLPQVGQAKDVTP